MHHHEVAVVGADDQLAEVGRQASSHQAVDVEDAGVLGALRRTPVESERSEVNLKVTPRSHGNSRQISELGEGQTTAHEPH